jgi:hypothetical protein
MFNNDGTLLKIASAGGKYITRVDNDIVSKPKLKTKQHGKNQSVTYNTQGELIVGGKCLTYKNKPNPELFFSDCDKSDTNQKWHFADGQISPKSELTQCMAPVTSLGSSQQDEISVKNCDNSDEQTWDTENPSISTSTDYSVDEYKGKTVVLVEADDPWYINVDSTIPTPVRKMDIVLNDVFPTTVAAYESDMILDMSRPDLGMGHSYASRQGIDCQKIEGFNGTNSDNANNKQNNGQNFMIMMICFLILGLILHKYKKSKNM